MNRSTLSDLIGDCRELGPITIEPPLPKRQHRNRRYAGRIPIPDRAVLAGILFVLRNGILWNLATPRHRLRGEHDLLVALAALATSGDLEGPARDPARRIVPPRPVRSGSRRRPLVATLTAANRHDITQLTAARRCDTTAVWTRRPIRAEAAGFKATAATIRSPTATSSGGGIASQLATCRTSHGSGLGRTRWAVERALAWLHRFRSLAVRYERWPCMRGEPFSR